MGDYIAFASFIISTIAIIISVITSTKKYELAYSQRQELLNWYSETVEVLILLRQKLTVKKEDKIDDLARLSMLIEKGRFFFPNVDKKDGHGKNKPTAYRGHRQVILDFLVFSYDIFNRDDAEKYFGHVLRLQKLFTSKIFDILTPKSYVKSVKRYTGTDMRSNITFSDFLQSDPQKYYLDDVY